MKSNFARNLQIGSGVSLLLLLISSVASYFSISQLLDSSKWVNHTYQVISEIEGLNSSIKDTESGQRGYLLTGQNRFIEPYADSYRKAISTVDHIIQLTKDNTLQGQNGTELKEIVIRRLTRLQLMIDRKKAGFAITAADLDAGNTFSEQFHAQVKKMISTEKLLLSSRTEKLQRYASFTPGLIILASILSLSISGFFLTRVMRDFRERMRLQKGLEEKDIETSRRIDIIQGIAGQISAGDYAIRLDNDQADGLGILSVSLNKMAESLSYSFNLLSEKEWLQTGIARLNERMMGEKDLEKLAAEVIAVIAGYSHSQVGTLYITEPGDFLKLSGSYAFSNDGTRERIAFGHGLAGECARTGSDILVKDIPSSELVISYAAGEVHPSNVIAFPFFHDGIIKGVIELASIEHFTEKHLEFFRNAAHNVGIAVNTAQSRRKMQELLEETQAQSEELQSQHGELENLNTEMEAQTQRLQASEEELRVQQEELLQANQELEERSRMLEEKNQVIVERNLDIQQKADQLEQSTRYKSEFLANMSHELRTPLNSILLLSRMMSENAEHNLSSEQVESANVIQNSGRSLLTLIDEILDLSKIEAGKMDLDYATIELEEICRDMQSLFAPIAREKNLELNVATAPGLPSAISTDKLRLEQILKNLLSNALKFTAKGSVTLAIAPGKGRQLEFSVKDTGIGIPVAKQGLIFEAFQQADGSTRRKYGGTGLGLSISRELAKLLGGEISLKSDPGKGSEFTVSVPTEKTDAVISEEKTAEEPAAEISEENANPGEPIQRFVAQHIPEDVPDDRSTLEASDKVVLIVEDDTLFAKALLEFTHRRNYKGVISVRGDQAIEMAHTYKPVAILLDIQLPVKDGWEVMDELKNNPRTRHIPVHIMSSLEFKKESITKGAVDFISKPFALESMQQVFQKLEDALNKGPRKVLIVEENPQHAKALAYYLETFNVNSEIKGNVKEGIDALKKKSVDCVILDMGIPDKNAYETLESVKQNPGLEELPIIIFTGRNLSKSEEGKIRKYADSIVVKTAHSYQRILDEVALFLHLVEENMEPAERDKPRKMGGLNDILRNKKVLIADDDVRNIYSITKSLEQHKIRVVSATDGKEALKQLDANPDIDLVLMDVMMPEMDGYEATREIRKQPKFRNLPVLAVTAKAMVGDREKCIEAGASDYISKPVDVDQLISLMRVWLYDRTI